jgi:hypothetical protein
MDSRKNREPLEGYMEGSKFIQEWLSKQEKRYKYTLQKDILTVLGKRYERYFLYETGTDKVLCYGVKSLLRKYVSDHSIDLEDIERKI